MLYRTLRQFEQDGLVTSAWDMDIIITTTIGITAADVVKAVTTRTATANVVVETAGFGVATS